MNLKEITAKENHGKLAMVAMRVFVGVMFLKASVGKVTAGDAWSGRMMGFINGQENTPAWFKIFLDNVVSTNAELFAFLVAYGEVAIGLALIFGLMARPALFFGIIMVAVFMLTKGTPFWVPSNHDSFYIITMIALFFNHPGRFLGLDTWLAGKFPKIPT